MTDAAAPSHYRPSQSSALFVKILSPRGKIYSVKTTATHDLGVAGNTSKRHLIDAAFLMRLPEGKRLRASLVDAPCAHVSTKVDPELRVLGMLSQPLAIKVKTLSNDVQCADEERYQAMVELLDVLCVEDLCVPLHVSTARLRDDKTIGPILDVCGCPGVDDKPLEKDHFASAYQKHEFWLRDDIVDPGAGEAADVADEQQLGALSHVDDCLELPRVFIVCALASVRENDDIVVLHNRSQSLFEHVGWLVMVVHLLPRSVVNLHVRGRLFEGLLQCPGMRITNQVDGWLWIMRQALLKLLSHGRVIARVAA